MEAEKEKEGQFFKKDITLNGKTYTLYTHKPPLEIDLRQVLYEGNNNKIVFGYNGAVENKSDFKRLGNMFAKKLKGGDVLNFKGAAALFEESLEECAKMNLKMKEAGKKLEEAKKAVKTPLVRKKELAGTKRKGKGR